MSALKNPNAGGRPPVSKQLNDLAALAGRVALLLSIGLTVLYLIRYKIIYSPLDGLVTFMNLLSSLFILSALLVIPAGLAARLLVGFFRRLRGGKADLILPRLFGLSAVLFYFTLMPPIWHAVRTGFKDMSYLAGPLIWRGFVLSLGIAAGAFWLTKSRSEEGKRESVTAGELCTGPS